MLKNFICIEKANLSKCDKTECKYNLLCMQNYQKSHKTIINTMCLINKMIELCWNILFPPELKQLIAITYLNLIKQDIPKYYVARHCYFKDRCHENFEWYCYSFNTLEPIVDMLSGDFCYRCFRSYCKKCYNTVMVTQIGCKMCKK